MHLLSEMSHIVSGIIPETVRLSSSKLMSNYISGVMPFSLTSSYFFLDDYFVLVRKFYGCIVLHCVVLSKFL